MASLSLEVGIIPNTMDGQRNGNNKNDSDGDDSEENPARNTLCELHLNLLLEAGLEAIAIYLKLKREKQHQKLLNAKGLRVQGLVHCIVPYRNLLSDPSQSFGSIICLNFVCIRAL